MFTNSEDLKKDLLKEFIEAPSQNLDRDQIKVGVKILLKCIEENPDEIIDILQNHEYIPANNLFTDLASKIKSLKIEEYVKKFESFFDKKSDILIKICIFNANDLERLVNAIPSRISNIIEEIKSNEVVSSQIMETMLKKTEVFKRIEKLYPEFDINCYQKPYK